MSAVRYAVLQSIFFIILLVLASIVLQHQIATQAYEDIDQELTLFADDLALSFEDAGGMPKWYALGDDELVVNRIDSFRSTDNEVYGPVKEDVFNENGFSTFLDEELFESRFLRELYVDGSLDAISRELDSTLATASSEHLRSIDEIVSNSQNLNQATEFLPVVDLDYSSNWRVYVTEVTGGKIAVYISIDETNDVLDVIPSILWPIGILLVVTTLIGGILFGSFQQHRLARISNGLKQIASGDLSVRMAPKRQRDDLDELMTHLDHTTETLDRSITQIKHNAQHFAHELRTPMTHLKNELELANESVDLSRAISKVDDVIRIFNAVQRISRLNHRHVLERQENISLNDAVNTISDLYKEVIEDSGKSLKIVTNANGYVVADRQLIIQLLCNLIENAMRYAGEEAMIWITSEDKLLKVEDNGLGIPKDIRGKVELLLFKRQQSGEGQGLGLALVRAIADFHHAELVLDDSEHGGLSVEIRFRN